MKYMFSVRGLREDSAPCKGGSLKGGPMEALYFLILWLGGALLHTLYDLKLKPYFKVSRGHESNWPFS